MSGRIRVGSPWMRAALADFGANHPELLAELEARIPDGAHVSLFCGGRPRPLGATLVRGYDQIARVEPGYHTVGGAVEAVLHRAAELVIEEHDGFLVVADVA